MTPCGGPSCAKVGISEEVELARGQTSRKLHVVAQPPILHLGIQRLEKHALPRTEQWHKYYFTQPWCDFLVTVVSESLPLKLGFHREERSDGGMKRQRKQQTRAQDVSSCGKPVFGRRQKLKPTLPTFPRGLIQKVIWNLLVWADSRRWCLPFFYYYHRDFTLFGACLFY